ncbi:MAG: ABC transporter permease [Cyclobacteriaceae bacterium]|nr:ABC transporter permease [Cyclobacteriaceae bacterium]
MKLSLFIARRYFFSKKKKNFINIISLISMLAVAVGTMALVVVLSVFNGLEDLIRSLHNYFDPELKIVPSSGKSFEVNDEMLESIRNTEGVAILTQVVEDNAYVQYRNAKMVVNLKGVEENFIEHRRLDKRMVQGELKLRENGIDYAIMGRGVQYALNVMNMAEMHSLQIYYPRKGRVSTANIASSLNRMNIMPAGVFAIEKQYDMSYIFVPLGFAIDLLDYENRRTSLEVKVQDGYSINATQRRLKALLGEHYEILNSDEQHSSLLKAIKIEKLFVYLTFSFILLVASFNIFFSLTMLAIDKKKDIAILYAMGANNKLIKSIFLSEGAIISFSGAFLGLSIGLIICIIQQQFGIVSMGMATSVLESYPVKMQAGDFLYTGLTIILITLAASYRPAHIATRVDLRSSRL